MLALIIALSTLFAPGCPLRCYECPSISPLITKCDADNLKNENIKECISNYKVCTSTFTAGISGTSITRSCGLASDHPSVTMDSCTNSGEVAICICSTDGCNNQQQNVTASTVPPATTTSGSSTHLRNSFINITNSLAFILIMLSLL